MLSIPLTRCRAAGPDFRRLEFRDNRASMEGLTVELAEPDDPDHPSAWQGPLQIAGRCTANISLITAVYVSHGARYLIAISYSGSLNYAHYIDVQNAAACDPRKRQAISPSKVMILARPLDSVGSFSEIGRRSSDD